MNGRHTAASDRVNEYPELEEIHGEDPARFLESNELMATARIAGIRDPDLFEAYERVAEEITAGSYRTTILEAIADRAAALGLGDELADAPTPDATTDPVPATDGGTTLEYSEDTDDESEPTRETQGADIHPDARGLEAGEVLVVEYPDATEHIFPATDEHENPYFLVDAADTPTELTFDDVLARLEGSPEPVPIADVPIDAPAGAATGGDA